MPVTNLMSMPLAFLEVETGTNEDWVDSLKFLVDDGTADPPQLDIRGITFEMEVRRSAPDHGVVINASTEDGSLIIGEPPDYGFLIISVDHDEMKIQQPGAYVADIVGTDDENRRRVVVIDLTIIEGVTR